MMPTNRSLTINGPLPARFNQRPIIIVMGVSGCGKSSIGTQFALRHKLTFLEGDNYHSKSNIDKMANGIALNDIDRWPWLSALGEAIAQEARKNGGIIASCSSLKKRYREYLLKIINQPLVFVYLHGNREQLIARLSTRKNHYMPTHLLDSQLQTLEKPEPDEPIITLTINRSIEDIVKQLEYAIKPLIRPQ